MESVTTYGYVDQSRAEDAPSVSTVVGGDNVVMIYFDELNIIITTITHAAATETEHTHAHDGPMAD